MNGIDAALREVLDHRVIPVVVVADVASAHPLAEALVRGGLPLAEVTLRTAGAEEVVAAMASRGDVLVGAGTVLVPEQVDRAVDAGARFVVSPGFDPEVVARCRERGLPVLPGVSTASDLMAAHRSGVGVVKFFPAEVAGGAAAIRALSGPFPDVSFVPTGGVRPERLDEYLSLPCVPAVGGTWIAPAGLLAAGDFRAVEQRAAAAVEAAAALAASVAPPGTSSPTAGPAHPLTGAA